ncbi:hypothetical protein CXB77_06065 (plasmid) [Chromatium okenii]|uniref:Uncharacterized protein n=1 Tax=Chromatium okenii TaxID=61644 RepID=A0A2S7XSQ7_9GAMM|nr:hypothetical protein CXB77_06065 [Chromatium okenii]
MALITLPALMGFGTAQTMAKSPLLSRNHWNQPQSPMPSEKRSLRKTLPALPPMKKKLLAKHAHAAAIALQIWTAGRPVDQDKYLDRKQVRPVETLRHISTAQANEIVAIRSKKTEKHSLAICWLCQSRSTGNFRRSSSLMPLAIKSYSQVAPLPADIGLQPRCHQSRQKTSRSLSLRALRRR